MSHCKFFATAAFLLCTSSAFAGELKASDIEVVAVTPRSPDVRPYAMAIPFDGEKRVVMARDVQDTKVAAAASRDVAQSTQVQDRKISAGQ